MTDITKEMIDDMTMPCWKVTYRDRFLFCVYGADEAGALAEARACAALRMRLEMLDELAVSIKY